MTIRLLIHPTCELRSGTSLSLLPHPYRCRIRSNRITTLVASERMSPSAREPLQNLKSNNGPRKTGGGGPGLMSPASSACPFPVRTLGRGVVVALSSAVAGARPWRGRQRIRSPGYTGENDRTRGCRGTRRFAGWGSRDRGRSPGHLRTKRALVGQPTSGDPAASSLLRKIDRFSWPPA